MRILSTKILTQAQKQILSNYKVDEVDMIDINFKADIKVNTPIEWAIFTSKNAVRSVFEINKIDISLFDNVACVGTKTAHVLNEFGIQPKTCAKSAKELALKLVVEELKSATFFAGKMRRDELPDTFKEHHISLNEIIVYETVLIPTKIDQNYDYILFYSPSGIRSFLKVNTVKNQEVVCIGNTTTNEAKQYFKKVHIANIATVDGVLHKTKEIITQNEL